MYFLLDIHGWQRDRAAWLMKPKDSLVDTVAENLLDRLEVFSLAFFFPYFFLYSYFARGFCLQQQHIDIPIVIA